MRSSLLAARNAVGLSFVLNGFCFATWVSRIPDVRASLDLDNGQLGLFLLALAAGSLLAMPFTGAAVARVGTVPVIRLAGVAAAVGLIGTSLAVDLLIGVPAAALGLFVYGVGTGVWDVTMNVEAAEVERRLGRTVMPRFHAGFSIGAVAGAGLGALAVGLDMPLAAHVGLCAIVAVGLMLTTAGAFLPPSPASVSPSAFGAWLEPRTLLIGCLVLALALTEGTANDWLAVALVDGYDVAHWAGVAGFAIFVSAMTVGRLVGPVILDRCGRPVVLWGTIATAVVGVLLIVFGHQPGLVVLGIVLWGLGASLGFPVGMSAAADDPVHAAARVSVVSTIGYAAFLAGPPLLGFVADRTGTLQALLVVACVLIPAVLVVPAARQQRARTG